MQQDDRGNSSGAWRNQFAVGKIQARRKLSKQSFGRTLCSCGEVGWKQMQPLCLQKVFMEVQSPRKQMSMPLFAPQLSKIVTMTIGGINLCHFLVVDVCLFYGVRTLAAWNCLSSHTGLTLLGLQGSNPMCPGNSPAEIGPWSPESAFPGWSTCRGLPWEFLGGDTPDMPVMLVHLTQDNGRYLCHLVKQIICAGTYSSKADPASNKTFIYSYRLLKD